MLLGNIMGKILPNHMYTITEVWKKQVMNVLSAETAYTWHFTNNYSTSILLSFILVILIY